METYGSYTHLIRFSWNHTYFGQIGPHKTYLQLPEHPRENGLCPPLNFPVTWSGMKFTITMYTSHITRKPVLGVCDQLRHKLVCSASEASYSLKILDQSSTDTILSKQQKTKALIRPRLCCSHKAQQGFSWNLQYIQCLTYHLIFWIDDGRVVHLFQQSTEFQSYQDKWRLIMNVCAIQCYLGLERT